MTQERTTPPPHHHLLVESSSGSRGKQNYCCAEQTNCCADDIPFVRPVTLNKPEPQDRSGNVNAAVSSISTSCGFTLNQREEVSKEREGDHAWYEPEGRFVEAKPRPKSEASCNFSERSTHIGSESDHVLIKHKACALAKSETHGGRMEYPSPQPNRLSLTHLGASLSQPIECVPALEVDLDKSVFPSVDRGFETNSSGGGPELILHQVAEQQTQPFGVIHFSHSAVSPFTTSQRKCPFCDGAKRTKAPPPQSREEGE